MSFRQFPYSSFVFRVDIFQFNWFYNLSTCNAVWEKDNYYHMHLFQLRLSHLTLISCII